MSFEDFLRQQAGIAVREALALQSNEPSGSLEEATLGSSTNGG